MSKPYCEQSYVYCETHTYTHTGARLGKSVAPLLALISRWGCHKVLQPTNINYHGYHVQSCCRPDALLVANQQCQSTEGIYAFIVKAIVIYSLGYEMHTLTTVSR